MRTFTEKLNKFSEIQLKEVRSIDIIRLAEQERFELKKDWRGAYKAINSGGLFVFPETNTYYCHTTEKSGDTISFIMDYRNVGFADAVNYLLGQTNLPIIERKEYTPPPKYELHLPYQAKDNRCAFAYLSKTRGIDPDIINQMIKQNKLYQANYFNKETQIYETVCAFIGHDNDGKAKYCSMRGTTPESTIKRDKTGSDKECAFCMEGRSNRIYVVEAPIEALAHATLTKENGRDWTLDHRISLGGMSKLPLDRYLEKHSQVDTIIFGLNNDYDKVNRFGKPVNWGQIRAKKLIETYSERGYKVKNQVPVNVDFDDDLMCYRKHKSVFREQNTPAAKQEEMQTEQDSEENDEEEWLP